MCRATQSPMLPESHAVNVAVTWEESCCFYPGRSCGGCVGKKSESRSNNELQEVSRSQARTWTLKYRETGESGLEDRRGKRKHEQEPRSKLEQMQIRIARLEHQLYIAEMENHLLKKLKEVEKRDLAYGSDQCEDL